MAGRRLAWLLLGLAGCDCGGGAGLGRVEPEIAVDPLVVDFGEVPAGATRLVSVTVQNVGSGLLTIAGVDVVAPFTARLREASLEPGATTTLLVGYAPLGEDASTGQVFIRSDARNTPTVAIEVSGRAVAGRVDVNPRRLDFGTTAVGSVRRLELVLQNRGLETITGRLRVDGLPRPENFRDDDDTPLGQAPPFAAAARSDTTLTVTYAPTALGLDDGALLIETGTCGDRCGLLVDVGARASEGRVRLEPGSIDFGDVGIGQPARRTITVSNVGTQPLELRALRAEGGAEVEVRSARGLPLSIGPASATDLEVTYTPASAGTLRGAVVVETDDAVVPEARVSLSGRGLGPRFEVSPEVIDFGTQSRSVVHRRSFLLANAGSSEIDVREVTIEGAPVFGLDGLPSLPARLAGGESLIGQVTFTPVGVETAYMGTLRIRSSDAAAPSVELPVRAGFAAQACELEVAPGRVAFGIVAPGGRRDAVARVTNRGARACTLRALEPRQGDDPALQPTASFAPGPIAPGASVTLPFAFTPRDARTVKATWAVVSDDPVLPDNLLVLTASSEGYVDLFFQPDRVDFQQLRPNCGRREREVTLFNTGTDPAVVERVTFTTTTAALSMALAPTPLTIAGGATARFTFAFQPTQLGRSTGLGEFFVRDRPLSLTLPVQGEAVPMPRIVDSFVQESRRAVDVLFVIDDSCSMQDEQAALVQNFGSFIQQASLRNVDFRLSVTTTDVDTPGAAGRLRGPQMTPATVALSFEFGRQVAVGTMGSGHEQGLEAMSAAFARNTGADALSRRGIPFALVIVSDEDDFSPATPTSYFGELRRKATSGYQVFLITGGTMGCLTAAPAPTYEDFRVLTRGVALSICAPWGATLARVGNNVFGLQTNFALSTPADVTSPIEVLIDGVPAVAGTWTYEPTSNSIDFSQPPPGGARLEVRYVGGC
jgi:hypothetical protein